MENVYPNWRCYSYHVYGDRTDKEWSYQELKEFFAIDGTDTALCIKRFEGKYFTFNEGDYVRVETTIVGTYIIRS